MVHICSCKGDFRKSYSKSYSFGVLSLALTSVCEPTEPLSGETKILGVRYNGQSDKFLFDIKRL